MADPEETCAKPAAPEGKPAALSCQVCGESLTRRRVVRCTRCKTLHHLECWRFNQGCSMYGCGCRSWEEAPFAVDSALPDSFERRSGMTGAKVGALLCGIYSAIAICLAVGFAVGLSLLAAAIPAAVFACLLPIAVRFGLCRDRLHLDPGRRALHRTLELGPIRLAEQDPWLGAAEVAELQLHVYGGQHGAMVFSLYALLMNGRRKLLRTDGGPATGQRQEEMDHLVERLAAFLDCTVRKIDGRTPPTQAEIGEAIAQKRLAHAAAGRPAAPAATAPASGGTVEEPAAPPKTDAETQEPRREPRPERTR